MTPINIFKHDLLGLAVSGLELYSLITISKAQENRSADYFKDRIKRFNLVENKDYVLSQVARPGSESGRLVYEYTLNLASAKKIADWQPAKRGLGVLAYIREYERTGGNPVVPATGQLTSAITTEHSATSAISVLSETKEAPAPKLLFDEALPELEKLGPPMQLGSLPVSQLSPMQQLLQQVQKLAEVEANREDVPSEIIASLDGRLKTIEKKLNSLVFLFQQSANALSNIVPVQSGIDPVPPVGPSTQEQTTRSKIVRLVDAWVTTTKTTHQELWNWLYAQLLQRYRFDAYAYGRGQKESKYLDIVEEHGQLENLYAIADQCLRPK
jgi:phage anti-repressor protein